MVTWYGIFGFLQEVLSSIHLRWHNFCNSCGSRNFSLSGWMHLHDSMARATLLLNFSDFILFNTV